MRMKRAKNKAENSQEAEGAADEIQGGGPSPLAAGNEGGIAKAE